jgi:hypothetical protein
MKPMGTYKNVMELLTEEAVEQHLKRLSPQVAAYMKPDELVAYALNQLPCLYATTERGLEYQLRKGRSQYKSQINQAVRRAIAAVQQDPIRRHPPLAPSDRQAHQVLQKIRTLFQDETLNWDAVSQRVEQMLAQPSSQALRSPTEASVPLSHRQQAWQDLDAPPPSLPSRHPWRHPFAQPRSCPATLDDSQGNSTINLDHVPEPVPDSTDLTDWAHPLSRI